MSRLQSLFAELVRRRVIRLLGAYLVFLWLLSQGIAALAPAFDLPSWTTRAVALTGLALVPVLTVAAWKYNLVPPQIVRDAKDAEATNPGQKYASRRHDPIDCGVILARWSGGHDMTHEKQSARPITLGREPGNVIELDDPRVSRHHAVVWAERGQWLVRDLGSANGTFLDGEAITDTTPLPATGRLQLHPEGPTVRLSVIKSSATVMQLPDATTA